MLGVVIFFALAMLIGLAGGWIGSLEVVLPAVSVLIVVYVAPRYSRW